jgi:ABC-2 type transport system permease protein
VRKVLVVALREYNAAVRTKAFLIGLLIMPLLMGGSILASALLGKYRDTKERKVAVVDRTPGAKLFGELQEAVKAHNDKVGKGELNAPPVKLEEVKAPAPDKVEALRLELSDRVRRNELSGFLEIGPEAAALRPSGPEKSAIRYQSNRLTDRDFPDLAQSALRKAIFEARAREAKVSKETAERIVAAVGVQSKGLSVAEGGQVKDATETARVASFAAPFVLMMLMFMLTLMSATPLMQGVVEEKMQRIAEVLLGSVSPFQLMLGKLLGMAAVSLTIAVVYLGGAYWTAHHFGVAEHVTWQLIAWFFFYQTLAALMYGSLFIAVGAACTDLRETQNLLWPVMLLAVSPMFVLGNVIREPNSTVVTVLSFWPFATPTLMIGRQSLPPGVPSWQPLVAGAGVLLATLACVWAAGRVFRVGILLQGKGANPAEIARWIIRG